MPPSPRASSHGNAKRTESNACHSPCPTKILGDLRSHGSRCPEGILGDMR
ncbi:hypothetical protein [Streptomyces sp. NPDC056105]